MVDPDLTMTQPAMVTASCGMDILCHALESWTARWFADFDAKQPEQRVPYCGANPIADMWSEKALSLLAGAFRRAVRDGSDAEAREQMALAATFAGLGFGNAGVHVPHACAYPIAGRVRDYRPAGYRADEPIVPHGMAVAMTAPAAFALHLRGRARAPPAGGRAAGWARSGIAPAAPGHACPAVLRELMRDIGLPSGLAELGFGAADVDDLVGRRPQAATSARDRAASRSPARTWPRCSGPRSSTGERGRETRVASTWCSTARVREPVLITLVQVGRNTKCRGVPGEGGRGLAGCACGGRPTSVRGDLRSDAWSSGPRDRQRRTSWFPGCDATLRAAR